MIGARAARPRRAPPARRPLDKAPLWTDPRAYRAIRVRIPPDRGPHTRSESVRSIAERVVRWGSGLSRNGRCQNREGAQSRQVDPYDPAQQTRLLATRDYRAMTCPRRPTENAPQATFCLEQAETEKTDLR